MCVLAVLQLVSELDVEIGGAIHSDDCAEVTIHLHHYAQLGKLDAAAADHAVDELLGFDFFGDAFFYRRGESLPGHARAVEWGSYAARAWRCSVRHGSLARASAAIGGGLTLLPHMCTCWVLVKGLPSAPWLMM